MGIQMSAVNILETFSLSIACTITTMLTKFMNLFHEWIYPGKPKLSELDKNNYFPI